jgi:hypothetical protein
LGHVEVDVQFWLGDPFDRQISGLGSLQNAINEPRHASDGGRKACAEGQHRPDPRQISAEHRGQSGLMRQLGDCAAVGAGAGHLQDEECPGALAQERGNGGDHVVKPAQQTHIRAQALGCGCRPALLRQELRHAGIAQDRQPGEPREGLLEELDLPSRLIGVVAGRSRDIASGPVRVPDQPSLDRIENNGKDDRDVIPPRIRADPFAAHRSQAHRA